MSFYYLVTPTPRPIAFEACLQQREPSEGTAPARPLPGPPHVCAARAALAGLLQLREREDDCAAGRLTVASGGPGSVPGSYRRDEHQRAHLARMFTSGAASDARALLAAHDLDCPTCAPNRSPR